MSCHNFMSHKLTYLIKRNLFLGTLLGALPFAFCLLLNAMWVILFS